MEVAHTPGPWKLEISGGHWAQVGAKHWGMVAKVCVGTRINQGAVQSANASLITAAPELLAALRHFVDAFDGDTEEEITRDYGMGTVLRIRKGGVAIARATEQGP